MATKKEESKIQDEIQKWVRRQGGVAFKTNPTNRFHLPDIIGGVGGQPFAVEVKTDDPNSTPTEGQLITLAGFAVQGYHTGIVRSLDEFKQFVKEGAV